MIILYYRPVPPYHFFQFDPPKLSQFYMIIINMNETSYKHLYFKRKYNIYISLCCIYRGYVGFLEFSEDENFNFRF